MAAEVRLVVGPARVIPSTRVTILEENLDRLRDEIDAKDEKGKNGAEYRQSCR